MAASANRTVIFAALAGNAAVAVVKFAAAAFTGSAAMLSEAIHSVVDTGNQLLLLYGLRVSKQAPTPQHPFGSGLKLYFWTFVVALMIFGLGAVVSIWHGVEKILHPTPIENAWVNYLVLSAGIVFEGVVWGVALRAFNRQRGGRPWIKSVRASKDPTVFTVLFEDSAALLGLIVAFIGVAATQLTGLLVIDGIASVAIGAILAVTAIFLAAESYSLLAGESVDPDVRRSIIAIASAQPGVERVNECLTMHFGPEDVLVALSLDFQNDLLAGQVEETVTRIERSLKSTHPEARRIFIEAQAFDAHIRAQALTQET